MKASSALSRNRILFVCSGNSCRSQIAEGWARALAGPEVEVFSAGVEAHGLDPAAVAVMAEVGIDISLQRSKSIGVLPNLSFDTVVVLSERAAQHIRLLSRSWQVVVLRCESPVPRTIGAAPSLARYRRVRDDLFRAVSHLLEKRVRHAS